MTHPALDPVERVIAALTYDHLERTDVDDDGQTVISVDEAIPLLQRSISDDLEMIAREVPKRAKVLRAIGAAIDEALLAAAETRAALRKVQA